MTAYFCSKAHETHCSDAEWRRWIKTTSCIFRLRPLTQEQHPAMDNYSQIFVTTSSPVSSLPPGSWCTPVPQSVTVVMVTRQPGGGAMLSPCASRCTLTFWSWLTAWTSWKPVKTLSSVRRWPESRPSRNSCVTSCLDSMTSSGQKRKRSGWRCFHEWLTVLKCLVLNSLWSHLLHL